MSELLLNQPKTKVEINAYFDGARAAIRLFAVWQSGVQWVGSGRRLDVALFELEEMRMKALTTAEGE